MNKASLIQEVEMKPSINVMKLDIWNLQTTAKIKMFLWKSLSEAILVVDLIAKTGMNIDSRCQTCGEDGESINHVLFSGSLARQIWALSNIPWPDGGFDSNALFPNISYLLKASKNLLIPLKIILLFPWIVWYMWKNRNGLLF